MKRQVGRLRVVDPCQARLRLYAGIGERLFSFGVSDSSLKPGLNPYFREIEKKTRPTMIYLASLFSRTRTPSPSAAQTSAAAELPI